MKRKNPLYSCVFVFSLFCPLAFGQRNPETAEPEYVIPETKYPIEDAFVISFNIMDFEGADNTGKSDMAPLVRQLLERLVCSPASKGGVGNGGILYLPEGRYRLDSNIVIPKGVTIRGEWSRPEKGKPIRGTIVLSDFGRGEETPEKSLFILEPAAGLKNLAIWHPGQRAGGIVPYPPAIGYGAPRYFGNEYCVARNITFVNSYSGAVLLYGGGAPNMFGLYGTPLKRGIEIDYIAEVGRVEGADFSPEYWIGSGLPDAPSADGTFKHWLRNNGTAIVMRRNDWSYVSNVSVEGYRIGYHLAESKKKDGAKPNGQNFLLRFSDCRVALYAEAVASVGAMFHGVGINRCDYGLFIPKNSGGTLQLSRWHIDANDCALLTDNGCSTHLLVSQSNIESGKIETFGGSLVFLDSDVKTEKPQIRIGPEARGIYAGNRFSKKVGVINRSMFKCVFDGKKIDDFKKIPDFPYKDPPIIRQKPDRLVLYVATESKYGIRSGDNAFDNTASLQGLLDKAGTEGGGVVYLPAGKYRILGHLTIPTGVELQGATDIGSVPLGPGSVLEACGGKGDPEAPPLLTFRERSGMRGIVIDYPEQKYDEICKGEGEQAVLEPHVYPYAIRVAGKDVYLVNIGFRATFSGIDLFTHRCDNVYIDYPAGHFFTNGFRIGGTTENARICNAQFNTIGYACGNETKFGCWANARTSGDNQSAYRQNWRDLKFFILEDCKNLLLFNNFHFGSRFGTIFGTENGSPSGLALGHGIDAAIKALYFDRIDKNGFDLIGSQIVSLQRQVDGGGSAARYIETTPNFTGRVDLFAADLWGAPFYGIELNGGTVHLQAARFNNAGTQRLLAARSDTEETLRLTGTSVHAPANRPPVEENGTKRFSAEYSLLDSGNLSGEEFGGFKGNLSSNPQLRFDNWLERDNWTATASTGSASNMLDGNIDTRWGTGRGMQPGDWIALDFGSPRRFNRIVLDQGPSAGDFPQEYEVFVSDDENNWGDAVLTGEGTQGNTIVRFPEIHETRYLKIVLRKSKPAPNVWWSVAEIHVGLLHDDVIRRPFDENE